MKLQRDNIQGQRPINIHKTNFINNYQTKINVLPTKELFLRIGLSNISDKLYIHSVFLQRKKTKNQKLFSDIDKTKATKKNRC